MTTQLTTASGYKTTNMIFSDVQSGSIPNSQPAINYKRINISTKYSDGTSGDLIIPTEELFSFGVSENKNMETGKVTGHVMPLCLYNRDGPTQEQKDFVTTFNGCVEACRKYLLDNREEIEKYELEASDLKKLNPLYYKKEKGKVVEGTGPTLYAKLINSKKQGKILSMFFDYNGDDVDPLSLIGKYCYAKSAIKFESIFIGNKISLQIKLYETEVKIVETGMKRLLRRPKAQTRVLTSKVSNPMNEQKVDESESEPDSDGSIQDSDDEEKKSPPKKKVVRKVKKVIRKT